MMGEGSMFGAWVRRQIFWLIDAIKGKQIKKQYDEIKLINEKNLKNNPIIESKLGELLAYATEHVTFYKSYKEYKSLQDFPITNKSILGDAGDLVISDRYSKDELVTMKTSGTSGRPFTAYQNNAKKNRVRAEVVYFGELCNYRIGDRNVYLRVWYKGIKKSLLSAFRNNLIMIDIKELTEERLSLIRNRLMNDHFITTILGYASTLEIIVNYCMNQGDTPDMYRFKTIINTAESLNFATREKLIQVFGCNVVSRYSNQENGILAQELIGETYFHLNKGSYFFEFLKMNEDEPAEYGEPSRVVITDLYNYAMPMIRYDTQDIVIVENNDTLGEVITAICGRTNCMIYAIDGTPVYYVKIDYDMLKYNMLYKYHLIQESQYEFTMKVVDRGDKCSVDELVNLIKNRVGKDARVTIEDVDELPSYDSGKYVGVSTNYLPDKVELIKYN